MKKKFLAASLVCSLLLTLCAASCTKKNDEKSDLPSDIESEIILDEQGGTNDKEKDPVETLPRNNAFDSIPSKDFGGREFVIVTTEPDFCDSEEDKGIIGSELYARNRAIEEKFNIKITCVQADELSIRSTLQQDEEQKPDLIYAPQSTIAYCSGSDLLMNIYSLPYFEYEKEHTQPELLKALSQSDTSFGIYGDAAYDERSVWCVYYNKDILSYLGFVDAYDLVREDKWTWDMFLAIAEGAMLDTDNNRRFTAGTDRFGYSAAMNTSDFANAVFASFGKTYFSKDEDGFIKMDFAESDEDKYISTLLEICVSHKAKYPKQNPGNEAFEAFEKGQLAFFCDKLSTASLLADSEVKWGILPMPKLYASDESYHSLVDPSVCGYAVPFGASDSSLSGLVLNAIYAYNSSYGTDVSEKHWVYHYLSDNTAALGMLEVLKTPVYDIAYAFGEGMPEVSMASYELLQQVTERNVAFSSLYIQNEKPFSDFVRNKFVN